MEKLLIGVDFGTDSVRALLVRADGRQLSESVNPYRRWQEGRYCCPEDNQFRQHPLDYLESLEEVLQTLLRGQNTAAVAGLALDATASTPCPVDEHARPLALHPEFADNPEAMFILWKDHTALAEAERINEVAANCPVDYRQYCGGTYSSEWLWSKMLYVLRRDSGIRQAACGWLELCDWVGAELCGLSDPQRLPRSRCAAGHKAMWHADWDGLPPQEFLTAVDPLLAGWRERLAGPCLTADRPIGELSEKWSRKLGLPPGVVVGGSGIDAHFGAVGAQIQPFKLVKVLGTSTCDIMAVPGFSRCVRGICGQVDGSVLPGMVGLEAGQAAFGDVYAWFRNMLGQAGEVSLSELEAEAAAVAPGSNGLLALDWFNGRRSPDANPQLSGAIFGLRLGSTRGMIYRALLEGTVFGAQAILERLNEEGLPVQEIIATGGISRKSALVMQLCADVFNLPIRIAASEQTCALGAAMFAAVAAGVHPDIMAAMAAMGAGYDREYRPQPVLVPVYRRLYRQYRKYGRLLEEAL